MSNFPCTRLKMSEQGEYLAIGASDGAVVVIETDSMKQVREMGIKLKGGMVRGSRGEGQRWRGGEITKERWRERYRRTERNKEYEKVAEIE